jgi:hypothetical protein
MKYCIAKHQEDISLNPLEYLMDENDVMLEFETKDLALNYLNEITESDLTIEEWDDENGVFILPSENCPKCGSHNVRDDFDFPDTMRCCENCGADYNSEGELVFDPDEV